MIVFVIEHGLEYEGSQIYGIYSTFEKAMDTLKKEEKKIDTYAKTINKDEKTVVFKKGCFSYAIMEVEVDK